MKYRMVGIIGAGPSGIAAAIQLTRYGVPICLFEGEKVGGLVRNAHWVENYPAFPQGISGLELASRMEQQLIRLGVELAYERVQQACWDGKQFLLMTSQGEMLCDYLIIASGTRARRLPPNLIHPNAQARVFYEVEYLNEPCQARIAIIGAGDAAFDYALNLVSHNQVLIINRTDEVRCLPLLWERAMSYSSFTYHSSSEILWIEPVEDYGLKLTISCRGTRDVQLVDYVLVAIGREPAMDFLGPSLVTHLAMLEAVGKCYRIGDVKNGIFRQTGIAVGDGLEAAMQIYHSRLEACA